MCARDNHARAMRASHGRDAHMRRSVHVQCARVACMCYKLGIHTCDAYTVMQHTSNWCAMHTMRAHLMRNVHVQSFHVRASVHAQCMRVCSVPLLIMVSLLTWASR
eukprot:6172258-Pleurochrysis_carterae.AAC.1